MVNRQRDRSSRCSSVALLAPAPSVQSAVRRPPGTVSRPASPALGRRSVLGERGGCLPQPRDLNVLKPVIIVRSHTRHASPREAPASGLGERLMLTLCQRPGPPTSP